MARRTTPPGESSNELKKVVADVQAQLSTQTELMRLQQETIDQLTANTDEINSIRDLSSAIAVAQTRDEIIDQLLKIVREKIMPFGCAALYQGSEELGYSVTGQWEATEADTAEIERQMAAGVLLWVIKSKAPIAMPASGRFPTAVYVPMKAGNRVNGILLLLTGRAVDEFTQSDQDRISLICSHAAVALENARLVDQILRMKEYNENLLLSLTSGLIAVDLEGRVTTVNPAALSILYIEAREVLGDGLASTHRLAPLYQLLTQTIETGEERRHVEIEIGGAEKEQILGITVSPIHAEGDRVIGALGVFRDLTPMKVLEKQVRRSDRLAVVGQMAAGAAHEIRNPLSAIRGSIQLLNRKLEKLPENGALLAKTHSIIEEVDRINRIVAGMMDMSKDKFSLQLSRIPINKILRDVGYIVEGNFKEAGVGLELDLDETLPESYADPSELKQVFLNLYQNALQAMPPNGKLTVVSRGARSGAGQDGVQVRLTDTGCGIGEQHLDKIFTPFFTTKKDGTGLGLAIVYRIVEEHGGQISVESTPGKGTTFTVWIPAAQELEKTDG